MGVRVRQFIFLLAFFSPQESIRGTRALLSADDIECPDPSAKCPDKTTCCQLPTKQWGCCPLEHAVCCEDGLHCCPAKTTCNLQAQSCDNGTIATVTIRESGRSNSIIPLNIIRQRMPSQKSSLLTAVTLQCRDKTFCDDESTCCQNVIGDWGCCPFKNGVCCPDRTHCCPNGTTCDATSGYCWYDNDNRRQEKATVIGHKWMKIYASITSNAVTCPGEMYKCKSNQTCCQLEDTFYGCCDLPDAICCPDKAHCCPSGSTCNSDNTCGQNQISAYGKTAALHVNEVKCPDHKTKCPTGTTCCPMSDTAYGCCPLPRAVCCEDKLHCCPTGTTCNVQQQACISARGKSIPWFTKFKP